MIMGEKKALCLGCMAPKTGGDVCPYCGYSDDTPYLPSYIAPGIVLSERYLVGKLLHYNGEGATYLGYDYLTNRKIFLKEYMPDVLCRRVKGSPVISVNQNYLVQYKTFMSEFTELGKLLAKMRTLNHITPALELFAENNTTYIVFDYIEGVPLRQYLQQNTLSWEEIRQIFPPIFTTLSLIHNAGIVHRGISPETLWITPRGELRLTGFCISAARTANTELAAELYPGYAALEQYSASNWQGTWTDVYAVSAILYRLLTGVTPIEAISRIGHDSLAEPVKLNRNIPSNVSKVIMQGLTLSGDIRIQTVTELVTRLFEQPDFSEPGIGMSRTQVLSVPRTSNQTFREDEMPDDHPIHSSSEIPRAPAKSRSKVSAKVQQIRIAVIVFILVTGILGIAALVALSYYNDREDKDPSFSASSTTSSLPVIVTTSPTVTTVSPVTSQSQETYTLGSFVGKVFDQIKDSETYKDWLVFVSEQEYNEEYPKGQIFDQSIEAGTLVTKGTELKVKVSRGSPYALVPDYTGMLKDDYLAQLNALDIKYVAQPEDNPEFLTGYVCRTSIEVGEKVNISEGETLTVYYSTYVPPEEPVTSEESSFPDIDVEHDPSFN